MRRKLARLANWLSDVLGDQLSLQFRPADLFDLQVDAAADQVLQFGLQDLDLLSLLADDQTGTSDIHHHPHLVAGPLDLDPIDPGTLVLSLLGVIEDEVAQLAVFDQQVGEVLLRCVPSAAPAAGDPGSIRRLG